MASIALTRSASARLKPDAMRSSAASAAAGSAATSGTSGAAASARNHSASTRTRARITAASEKQARSEPRAAPPP